MSIINLAIILAIVANNINGCDRYALLRQSLSHPGDGDSGKGASLSQDLIQRGSRFADFEFNLKHFGAVGDGMTDDTRAFAAAVAAARVRGGTIYIPEGTYILNTNAPIGQRTLEVAGLEDYNGLTIRGSGRNSIVKTVPSEGGADVFQLNGVRNITIRDIGIHSSIRAEGTEGSNGISITGGGENILIHNCHIYMMPFKVYADGMSTDGGHAITIQQAGRVGRRYANIRIVNNTADGGAYGFSYQGTDAGVLSSPIGGLIVQGNIFSNFYRGISVEVGATGRKASPLPGMGVLINGNSLIDCQQGILVNGSTGVVAIGNSIIAKGVILYPTKSRHTFGLMMLSSHNAIFSNNIIFMRDCDSFMRIGGGYAGESGTPSVNVVVLGNVCFGAASGFGIVSSSVPSYQSVQKSFFIGNSISGANAGEFDSQLFAEGNGNSFITTGR